MLNRRQFVSCAFLGAAAGISLSAGPGFLNPRLSAATAFSYPDGEFLQIEITDFSRVDDRFHYSAYRVSPAGFVTGAKWTARRALIGLTRGPVISPVPFAELRKAVTAELGFFRKKNAGKGGRFNNWISVAHSTDRRTRSHVLPEPVPAAIAQVARQFSAGVSLRKPERRGAYVITTPVQRSLAMDLDLGASTDQPTMADAIVASLSPDQLAVPVSLDRDVKRFLEGENRNRLVFAAKLEGRVTHFTVVTTA